MRQKALLLIALALTVGLLAGACAVQAEAPGGNVILIGWDGAQREHVNECLARGELPNLKALGDEGAMVDIDIAEVTDTKAGWAQILTGYSAEATGVYSNAKFQPIPKGYTVFERLEEFYGPENIATLAVIGKKGNVGAGAPRRIRVTEKLKQKPRYAKLKRQGTVVEENGRTFIVLNGEPYYTTKDSMDLFINGLGANDSVGAKALEALDQYKGKRLLFFIHFADVDSQGHKFGENSQEYTDALISCDTWLGKIRDKLQQLGLAGDTLLYVTADHGFDEGQKSHRKAPHVFLATNDKTVTTPGNRADITPTILVRLGMDLGTIQPPLDGKAL